MTYRPGLVFLACFLLLFGACTRNPLKTIEERLVGTFQICRVDSKSFVNGRPVVELCYADRGTLTLREQGIGEAVINGTHSSFSWKVSEQNLVITHPSGPIVFSMTQSENGGLTLQIQKENRKAGIRYLDWSRWTLEKVRHS